MTGPGSRSDDGGHVPPLPQKTALFEAVFEDVHNELLQASTRAAETAVASAAGPLELLARGCEAFLDALLGPEVQRSSPRCLGGIGRRSLYRTRRARRLGSIILALETAEAEAPKLIARLIDLPDRGATTIATSDTLDGLGTGSPRGRAP